MIGKALMNMTQWSMRNGVFGGKPTDPDRSRVQRGEERKRRGRTGPHVPAGPAACLPCGA
jgi:hypothetical protein